MLSAFGQPGVVEKTGQAPTTALNDLLIHGWDLATATGQDVTMPAGLAEAAYENLHGRFTGKQRQGISTIKAPDMMRAIPAAGERRILTIPHDGRTMV